MIISTIHGETITEYSSLHIRIAIHNDDAMSSGDDKHLAQHDSYPEAIDGADRNEDELGMPRRRSIAIHDLLNPAGQERSESPQSNCSPSRSVMLARARSNPNLPICSRRTCTPPPAHARRRRRTSSMSSGSRTRERRAFRPTYSDEEVYFIWYHRIDLGYDWHDINRAYNAQFPERPREGFGGIQCKYYRYCEECGVPKVRNRDRAASAVREYGMRSRTGLTYPWMMR